MRSKSFMQRVSRALTFLVGQVALVFVIALVAGATATGASESISDMRFAVFAISVYYLGFLIGPITLAVLIIWDNRAWMRVVSALVPIGVGAASYIATVYVQKGDEMSLLPDGAVQGAGWLLAAVVLLLAYNHLFGLVERAIWR
jgi:peptidoglycan/LPS O-acetylase OafA/YrhL